MTARKHVALELAEHSEPSPEVAAALFGVEHHLKGIVGALDRIRVELRSALVAVARAEEDVPRDSDAKDRTREARTSIVRALELEDAITGWLGQRPGQIDGHLRASTLEKTMGEWITRVHEWGATRGANRRASRTARTAAPR